MEKSGFQGREDTMKLIEALEGLEMKEGDDFPQGDKTLRKEDHQAFLREFIFEIQGGKYKHPRRDPEGEDDRSRRPASSPSSVTARRSRPRGSPAGRGRGAAGRPSCAPRASRCASAA